MSVRATRLDGLEIEAISSRVVSISRRLAERCREPKVADALNVLIISAESEVVADLVALPANDVAGMATPSRLEAGVAASLRQ